MHLTIRKSQEGVQTKLPQENDSVVYLADIKYSGDLWNVPDMLRAAQEDLRQGNRGTKTNKAILILLQDKDGVYDIDYYQAQFKPSEIISLLTVLRQRFINQLA